MVKKEMYSLKAFDTNARVYLAYATMIYVRPDFTKEGIGICNNDDDDDNNTLYEEFHCAARSRAISAIFVPFCFE